MRQIVDPAEWEEVIDPAWGIRVDDWETGYEVEGWEVGAWILHAMYENDEPPAGLTYDDVERIERAATRSPEEPERDPRDIDSLARLAELGTLVGLPIGASSSPQAPTASRTRAGRFPSVRRRKPLWIWSSSSGSSVTSATGRPRVPTRSASGGSRPLAGDFLKPSMYRAPLREGREIYSLTASGGPNNVWPVDRGWFVWTDHDLCGTRVSGSRELIDALLEDPDLEVLELS